MRIQGCQMKLCGIGHWAKTQEKGIKRCRTLRYQAQPDILFKNTFGNGFSRDVSN